jgi:hypothetical protein
MASHSAVIDQLLQSDEPSIRWKTQVAVLREDPNSPSIQNLREDIRNSPRVKTLLAHRDPLGRIVSGRDIYAKWQGAHWILATLADIGYPEGDASLLRPRDQVLDVWLGPEFYSEFVAETKAAAYKRSGVVVMQGRARRCSSQQGYALYYVIKLGLDDERVHRLVERLLHWQWPDGGWNCDKEPNASTSSFIHTIHSMRGLHVYAQRYRDSKAQTAADRAAEVILSRRLFKRRSNNAVIKDEFVKLHYPLYWHYDILLALKIMAETGHIDDARCVDALDLLESKRLPDGGWPAESRYYSASSDIKLNADHVDWGGTSKKAMNPWVTADALAVLAAAERLRT